MSSENTVVEESVTEKPQAPQVPKTRNSTLKLIFGYSPAYVLQDFNGNIFYQEFNSLIDSQKNTKNKVIFFKEIMHNIQGNAFWKNFSKRLWQFDDFTFKGPAAVCFLGHAHRYKMLLNPFELYKMSIMSSVLEHQPKREKDEEKKAFGERMMKWHNDQNTEFNEKGKFKIGGKQPDYDHYGINHSFYKEFKACQEKNEWSDDGWKIWSNLIFTNEYFRNFLMCVVMHEMMHVLWDHLTRVNDKNPMVWNYACDFAINSQLNWSAEVRKTLITEDSPTFWSLFVYSIMKYLMINDKDIRESVKKKYNLSSSSPVEEFAPYEDKLYNDYMTEGGGYNLFTRKKNKFSNQSAEFYYKVFMEANADFDKVDSGAHDHETWEIIDQTGDDGDEGEGGQGDQPGEGEGEGEGEGDGEGSGEGKGNGKGKGKVNRIVISNKPGKGGKQSDMSDVPEEVMDKVKEILEKKSKAKKGGDASGAPAEEKERGKGSGGTVHAGFNTFTSSAREEVKQTIKECVRKAGYNPDSPEDIERALADIPHLSSFGHIVKEWFNIRKKNWKRELCQELVHCFNSTEQDYTMSREHRAIDDTFPGKKRDLGIDLIIGVDTSGSINGGDWNDFILQIEKIAKDCDVDRARVIQCHNRIADDRYFNIRRAKNMEIKETGGTTMRLILEKLKREKNKKLLVLFTDGFIDDFRKVDYPGFRVIMFLSRGGVENRKQLEEKGFKVICQDDE
jgi:predicted metal-dependent peptidase